MGKNKKRLLYITKKGDALTVWEEQNKDFFLRNSYAESIKCRVKD